MDGSEEGWGKKYNLHNNKMTLAFGLWLSGGNNVNWIFFKLFVTIEYLLSKYLFVPVLECYYVVAVALIICFISAATQTYDILIAGTQGNCSDKAQTENDLKSSSSTNSINLTIYEINGYVCRSTKCCLNIHPFTHFLEILTRSFNQIECKWPKTMFSSSNEGFAFCTKTACCT